MKFSSMLLYVDDNFPNKQTFEQLLQVGGNLYRKGKFLYSVEQSFISNRHFWMYFQYDNENLYSDIVIDTTDNSSKSNPRPKSQVEMRSQLFACYDLQRNLLYVSDYSKKSAITNYIEEMLQKSAIVKNVYKSLDEFPAVVKYLKSVTFTQRRTIFTSTPESIFQRQANMFGLDLPEYSKLKLDYGSSPVGIVRTALQNWELKRESGEFEDVLIVGLDDAGFESTFNFSTMISNVEIDLARDENDRFNPDSVRTLLLEKLRA